MAERRLSSSKERWMVQEKTSDATEVVTECLRQSWIHPETKADFLCPDEMQMRNKASTPDDLGTGQAVIPVHNSSLTVCSYCTVTLITGF